MLLPLQPLLEVKRGKAVLLDKNTHTPAPEPVQVKDQVNLELTVTVPLVMCLSSVISLVSFSWSV